jgi:hypothetical protein
LYARGVFFTHREERGKLKGERRKEKGETEK